MFELLIHELVHAKLATMTILGVTDLPFNDHDANFFNEIKRLLDLLKKNLELGATPTLNNLHLVEGGKPSDGSVPLNNPITAVFETNDALVSQVTFRWINPLSEVVKEVTVPMELGEDTIIPDMIGAWSVEADSQHTEVLIATFDVSFFVVPESPVGTLAITGSSLAALGAFVGIRRYKTTESS
jgi:hypothetical protein